MRHLWIFIAIGCVAGCQTPTIPIADVPTATATDTQPASDPQPPTPDHPFADGLWISVLKVDGSQDCMTFSGARVTKWTPECDEDLAQVKIIDASPVSIRGNVVAFSFHYTASVRGGDQFDTTQTYSGTFQSDGTITGGVTIRGTRNGVPGSASWAIQLTRRPG